VPFLHGLALPLLRLFRRKSAGRRLAFRLQKTAVMFWWWTGILIALGIVLLIAAALSTHRRNQRALSSERRRTQFLRALSDLRQRRAERELERALAGDIVLRPLLPEEKERCRREWREIQARFPADPARAVTEAHRLADEIARLRGRDGIPPNIPANRIASRARRGQASLKELRSAMVQYGAIIADLLGNSLRATGS
jgi:hypothetical protein